METHQYDLVVIGGGPGGYVAAIRAAQLGLKTACVEFEKALGGTCLRVGCIPSKALLESSHRYHAAQHDFKSHGIIANEISLDLKAMLKRKDSIVRQLTKGVAGLLKKNDITRYTGLGRFVGPGKIVVEGVDNVTLETKNTIIATGSVSAPLNGIELDGDRIGTSTEALTYPEVPEHLVVIGAGVIGLELGSVWQRLGAKVTVLEYMDQILPGMDQDLCKEAQKIFKKQGLEFHLGKKVTGATRNGEVCTVTVDGMDPIDCDRVLLCVGRRPNTQGLGLENINAVLDKAGRVAVDEHFATTEPNVYAIGDVIRGPMLAHKAEEEGVACVEQIVTGYGHVNYDAIPGVVYTHPEIATVGKTEKQLKDTNVDYKKGVFPFIANGRAKAIGTTEGFAKILADAKTDRILGVHIIGPQAGDLIAEAAVAIEFSASSEDLARSSHAHPSLAEVVKEAAWDTFAQAISI
jgi:dihydrolipoamide dehydrogenase